MQTHILYHNLVDIHRQEIYPAEIHISDGKISAILKTERPCTHFILPGLIDAHVHIESSMLIPSEFARIAVKHGTVATVSDPHEIANVCGMEGIEFMVQNAKKVSFKFYFGAPSCVPATHFETAGDIIDVDKIETLLKREDIYYLSEMMNYPGVLFNDEKVMKKITIAKKLGKPIDGHAPGLRGDEAKQYIAAGISTDHECVTKEEALDKLQHGMKILIREGSAAKNFDALIDLVNTHENKMMFCCDDKHPDELLLHHINNHVKRGLALGIDIFKLLKVACKNPVDHYGLDVGLLQVGDNADFIVVDSLEHFNILKTVINGHTVFENSISHILSVEEIPINRFNCERKNVIDFQLQIKKPTNLIRVIEALDGQLITNTILAKPKIIDNSIVSDVDNDILKMVVVNRYQDAPIAIGFIKNVGLKSGAIASTVAHDSHNIICVGADDQAICNAVNALIDCKGGIAVDGAQETHVMPLPVAGLMSNESAEEVAKKYSSLTQKGYDLGSTLKAPFMTLSFMALLVIPELKLSDKGLFDGKKFAFVDVVKKE